MSFSIEIEETIRNPENGPYALGRIVMGSFEETFESPTHYWKPDDYRRHWKRCNALSPEWTVACSLAPTNTANGRSFGGCFITETTAFWFTKG